MLYSKIDAESILSRELADREWQFIERCWPIVKMHRDLSLNIPLERERERHMKCADAIWIQLVRGAKWAE